MFRHQIREACLLVTLTCGKAHMLLLVGDEARVARDFLGALHIAIKYIYDLYIIIKLLLELPSKVYFPRSQTFILFLQI